MTIELETKCYWKDSGGETVLSNSGHKQALEEAEVI